MQLSRREWLALLGKAAVVAVPMQCAVLAGCRGGARVGTPPAPDSSTQVRLTDDQLLEELERTAFEYFWNECSPITGQVKDRALANGGDTRVVASVAATGFGLTALCIGHERGYRTSAEIKARVRATLDFLLNRVPTEHGFFYHFFDVNTGVRAFNSEASSIDTALLLCGVVMARSYFSDDDIRSMATQIYNRVEWPWMLNGGSTFSMGWKPESGFLAARWQDYCELMMLYLLAIGASKNPVSANTWVAWARPTVTFNGITFISDGAPLFIHQFSHAWFDFRNKRDAYADYFDNSVKATRAHIEFCKSLSGQFPDYSDQLWGITSSDSAHGYVAWGGPPLTGAVDGTVVPAASAGSLVFTPKESLTVLHTVREQYGAQAWKKYGFVDAFNPLTGWYDADVIGIDVGISMLMAENQRTELVWNTFMRDGNVQKAMQSAGFK